MSINCLADNSVCINESARKYIYYYIDFKIQSESYKICIFICYKKRLKYFLFRKNIIESLFIGIYFLIKLIIEI